ncbi:MAG TPA: T9SS type A sorting domain-containing protein [Chitinophagaceae bacterium]
MKKVLLSSLLLCAISYGKAQVYDNSTETGSRYAPAPNATTGNPKITMDDFNVPSATVGTNNKLNITQVKFGIRRAGTTTSPTTVATTVTGYVGTVEDTATQLKDIIKLPLINIGSQSLPASTNASFTTEIVTFGNGSTTLATVQMDTGAVFTGYATAFGGLSLTNYSSTIPNGWRVTSGPGVTYPGFWLVDMDSSVKRAGPFVFSGSPTPPSDFYMQVFGNFTFPVSFLEIKASDGGNGTVNLTWATATEQHNKGFAIERSTDAVNYTRIGWVEGAGNSVEKQTYVFTDKMPVSGMNYYRIRQEDMDGKYSYSNVAFAKMAVPFKIAIAPNPVSTNATIRLFLPDRSRVEIQLLNMNGQLIRKIDNAIKDGGWHTLNFAMTESRGSYILRTIVNENEISNQMLIKN